MTPITGSLALVAAFESSESGHISERWRYQRSQLIRFAEDLAPRSLLDATTDDIWAFLEARSSMKPGAHGLPPRRYTGPSRRTFYLFYGWALQEGYIKRDPTVPIFGVTMFRRQLRLDEGGFGEMLLDFRISQERRGLSPRTILGRRSALRMLCDWMAPTPILEATPETIESFLDSQRLAAKSRYCTISSLHVFYRWAERKGLVDKDPTVGIDRPRLPRIVPRPISDADLIEAIDKAPNRIRAVLALAAYQGLRCKEIAGVQRDDIRDDLKPPILIVSSPKGTTQRALPLHPEVLKALRAHGLPRSGPVFLNDDDRPETPWQVSYRVNDYLHGLGIDATAHKLRHWFASTLYANTLDLRMVQEMLGHASPTTTAIYAAFNPGNAVDAVTALTPMG